MTKEVRVKLNTDSGLATPLEAIKNLAPRIERAWALGAPQSLVLGALNFLSSEARWWIDNFDGTRFDTVLSSIDATRKRVWRGQRPDLSYLLCRGPRGAEDAKAWLVLVWCAERKPLNGLREELRRHEKREQDDARLQRSKSNHKAIESARDAIGSQLGQAAADQWVASVNRLVAQNPHILRA
jgi:hypothetical protein